VGKKLLADAPVAFMAYDLLEQGGVDLRGQPQSLRRERLQSALRQGPWRVSPALQPASWEAAAALREQSRERGVEGFMLKSLDARYGSGRTKAGGTWWKWKVDPHVVDAVLIYAQAGHGRRASVYTDYTFAVWSRPPASAEEALAVLDAIARREPAQPGALQLLPFAKAYSGLSDEEFRAVDQVIRATTLEKFGPVRSVRPTLVFEIGFEGIGASPRHKSGVAVRFPRMLRIRHDKPVHEADSLQGLQALIGGR
jgi:DNA ligase-1